MRVKEAASIVVNMPKKKHKHAKKNRAAADTSGWLVILSANFVFFKILNCKYQFL